jgi:hypothetical protein
LLARLFRKSPKPEPLLEKRSLIVDKVTKLWAHESSRSGCCTDGARYCVIAIPSNSQSTDTINTINILAPQQTRVSGWMRLLTHSVARWRVNTCGPPLRPQFTDAALRRRVKYFEAWPPRSLWLNQCSISCAPSELSRHRHTNTYDPGE